MKPCIHVLQYLMLVSLHHALTINSSLFTVVQERKGYKVVLLHPNNALVHPHDCCRKQCQHHHNDVNKMQSSTQLFNNHNRELATEEGGNIPEPFPFDSASVDSILNELSFENNDLGSKNTQMGLSNNEVNQRLDRYGYNIVSSPPRKNVIDLFLEQFDDRLVQILLFVAGISTISSISDIIGMSPTGDDSVFGIFEKLVEPGIILLILVLNASLGVWQQLSAIESMVALEKLQPRLATVLRSVDSIHAKSEWITGFDATGLVPGDIIKMKAGDLIPADVKIISLNASVLRVDESFLTGESINVYKSPTEDDHACATHRKSISEQSSIAFSGATVTQGEAKALVLRTGLETEIGKIQSSVASIEDMKTPLALKLDNFGNTLALLIAIICIGVWFSSFPRFSDTSFPSSLNGALYYAKVSVALGVAAIPEGLPAVVTLVLALGTRRLAERNVIVRKLPSVETLGCVSVICSDKTGTLTMNQMTAVTLVTFQNASNFSTTFIEHEVTGKSYNPDGYATDIDNDELQYFPTGSVADIINVCFECNNAEIREKDGNYDVIGDPMEGALLCLATKLNNTNSPLGSRTEKENSWERLATLEFDRERKSMSVFCKPNPNNEYSKSTLFVKGAPISLLERCTYIKLRNGEKMQLTPNVREELVKNISVLSGRPLRCLLLAIKEIDRTKEYDFFDSTKFNDIESNLTVVGIIGIKDPLRADVRKSIDVCKNAGIKVMIISGDAKETTSAIAQELNIIRPDEKESKVFNGKEFFRKPKSEQISLLSSGNLVFSRTEPKDKQQIVNMLQSLNEIPAMTGDGVNDAPALRQASIGVAMGSGSDVAKEASDMILIDDSFSSIVSGLFFLYFSTFMFLNPICLSMKVNGVEEGRSIYTNIQAFINFLISCNMGEVLTILFASLMGFPSILTAIQLLWVNLATDGPAAIALGFNPPEVDIMKKNPRDINEAIVTPWLFVRYFVIGSYIASATVGIFAFYFWSNGVSINNLSHWSSCNHWSNDTRICYLFTAKGMALPQTLALSTLITTELLKAISTVSVNTSILKVSPLGNPYIIVGVFIPFIVHLIIIYSPVSESLGLGKCVPTSHVLYKNSIFIVTHFIKHCSQKFLYHRSNGVGFLSVLCPLLS